MFVSETSRLCFLGPDIFSLLAKNGLEDTLEAISRVFNF